MDREREREVEREKKKVREQRERKTFIPGNNSSNYFPELTASRRS